MNQKAKHEIESYFGDETIKGFEKIMKYAKMTQDEETKEFSAWFYAKPEDMGKIMDWATAFGYDIHKTKTTYKGHVYYSVEIEKDYWPSEGFNKYATCNGEIIGSDYHFNKNKNGFKV